MNLDNQQGHQYKDNKDIHGQGKQGQPRLRILARQERRHTLNEPKTIL